jgi:hypothetical protein
MTVRATSRLPPNTVWTAWLTAERPERTRTSGMRSPPPSTPIAVVVSIRQGARATVNSEHAAGMIHEGQSGLTWTSRPT